jgi:Redoxin
MRKFALSLVVLSLVAVPAFAGKYNKVISVGDKAPDFSGIPAVENGEDKSLTLSDIKEYMKENKSNYIYGYDESQAIGKAYGATNTPQFFVLDKERKIRYTGAMDDHGREDRVKKTYLRDAVDALLKGESVAVEETRPVGCGVRYEK